MSDVFTMENYMGKIPVNEGRLQKCQQSFKRAVTPFTTEISYLQSKLHSGPGHRRMYRRKIDFVTSLKSGHGAVQLHCAAAGWWWSGTAGQHENYSRKWPDP